MFNSNIWTQCLLINQVTLNKLATEVISTGEHYSVDEPELNSILNNQGQYWVITPE